MREKKKQTEVGIEPLHLVSSRHRIMMRQPSEPSRQTSRLLFFSVYVLMLE